MCKIWYSTSLTASDDLRTHSMEQDGLAMGVAVKPRARRRAANAVSGLDCAATPSRKALTP
jgi:hypothetical protein